MKNKKISIIRKKLDKLDLKMLSIIKKRSFLVNKISHDFCASSKNSSPFLNNMTQGLAPRGKTFLSNGGFWTS